MNAEDLMSFPVIDVDPGTLVSDVARKMLCHSVSAVLVLDEGKLVGIVSDGDLLQRIEIGTEPKHSWLASLLRSPLETATEFLRTRGQRAEDVMTRNVITVSKDANLEDVVKALETNGIRRVVVAEGGRPLGVISRRDLLFPLISATRKRFEVQLSSEEIREIILANIASAGLSCHPMDLKVIGDRVEINAIVPSETVALALIAAVEATPGVGEVTNGIVVIPSLLNIH